MNGRGAALKCLACCPLPYNGRGWPQTCVSVLSNFTSANILPTLVTPRARKRLPPTVLLEESLAFPASRLPWHLVAARGRAELESRFLRLLAEADPARTIAYFWPGSPESLVRRARQAGILTVREMINCFQGTAKAILDRACLAAGVPMAHGITQKDVEEEVRELALYDYAFASNPEVEKSLLEAGIGPGRILSASFGWSPSRFGTGSRRDHGPFRALFVGISCMRKGVADLIEAWKECAVEGELLLVGDLAPDMRGEVEQAARSGLVKHLPFTDDLGGLYRNADIFVFPTYEEGGPQVTLEAGGCGLPVITTAMGAGRLVRHEINGLLVEAGDIGGLGRAIGRLAADAALRRRFSERITADAQAFTYDRVSAERARMLASLMASSDPASVRATG